MSFYLSKILWLIVNPFNIFIFITIFTIFLYFISFRKLSLIIFLINFIFITFISFFPIGSYLTYNIEKEFHSNIKIPERVDGILILGGATNPLLFKEYDQISLNDSAERLVESVLIIRKFEKAKVIFSGGSGSINRSDLDHSQVAKLFYSDVGFDLNRVRFLGNSRNTIENFYSIKNENIFEKSNILITSAFHMKRAMIISKELNMNLIPMLLILDL